MFTLPPEYNTIFALLQPYFTRIWSSVRLLLIGAILSPNQRTVAAILRVVGLSQEAHFQIYHRVLNHAVWSSLELSRVLLLALLTAFVQKGPVVLGLDDTIERRRGAKIQSKGNYRDQVRSSHSHFVKASGLRWLSLMLPAPEPNVGQRGRQRKKDQRLPTLELVVADVHTAWQSLTVPNWYGQCNRTVEIVSDTAV